jgi:hypothetical protein
MILSTSSLIDEEIPMGLFTAAGVHQAGRDFFEAGPLQMRAEFIPCTSRLSSSCTSS